MRGFIKTTIEQFLNEMRYNESRIDDIESEISDILTEIEDDGLQVEISRKVNFVVPAFGYLEIIIKRPVNSPDRIIPGISQPPSGKYPGNLFFWYEVKDAIIRLNDWYYEYSGQDYTPGITSKTVSELDKIGIKYNSNSPFRMFTGGVEFGIGWHKPQDFDGLGDYISFDSLRIEIKM